MNIDKEKGGGYYVLEHVQMYQGNNIHFCDIYMVVDQLSDNRHWGQFEEATEDHVNLAKFAS